MARVRPIPGERQSERLGAGSRCSCLGMTLLYRNESTAPIFYKNIYLQILVYLHSYEHLISSLWLLYPKVSVITVVRVGQSRGIIFNKLVVRNSSPPGAACVDFFLQYDGELAYWPPENAGFRLHLGDSDASIRPWMRALY